MSAYSEYFLNSQSGVVQLETIAITHSAFSQTYYLVRNAVNGMTAHLETGIAHDFVYYPLQIQSAGVRDDLDQMITIQLGDLGDTLPMELDRVANANKFYEKPQLKYRVYRSDDLTTPLFGPIILEVQDLSFTKEGCAFTAKAPSLNINRTGSVYALDRFPMLLGFL